MVVLLERQVWTDEELRRTRDIASGVAELYFQEEQRYRDDILVANHDHEQHYHSRFIGSAL